MRAPARQVPDLVYGEVLGYRPLELDLYLPQTDGSVPVIVYLHGGGWRRGSRREPLPVLGADFYHRLTTQGFAVAAIDYRLSGEARFPAPLEDVRTAIGWVRDHAASYGLDADRVFLWGDSAGGHLALLAALTGSTVQGVVAWFPVTDLAGLPSDVADAGGVPDPGPQSRDAQLLGGPASSVPDLARQASPVSHASAAAPPILLMHGAVDDMVPSAQSIRLAEALGAAGATVELELVPGATHFWNGASDVRGIVQRSIEFLRARGQPTKLRDEDGWRPAQLILGYPVAHPVVPPPSASLAALMTEVPQILRFPPATTKFINMNYLGGAISRADGYAFPALAALEGLGPVLVLNAEYDDLRASGEAFAAALALAGVDVRQVQIKTMLHGFLNLPGNIEPVSDALDLIGNTAGAARPAMRR